MSASTRKKAKYQHHPSERSIRETPTIPDSDVYMQLVEQEKVIDSLIARRRTDMVEALKRGAGKINRTLRIHICNDYVPDRTDETGGDPASWTLKISGALVPSYDPTSIRSMKGDPKFSTFFKRIFIQLDPAVVTSDNNIEWTGDGGECDGLEIKRQGSMPVTARIFLYLDYNPRRYKLSPALAKLLNVHTDTLPAIVLAFWQYVKAHSLQDSTDLKLITCNAPLRKALDCTELEFSEVPGKLLGLLLPPDPLELAYEIKTSGDATSFLESYDVDVQLDGDGRDGGDLMCSQEEARELEELDEQLSLTVARLREASRRRQLLLRFSESPVEFIDVMVKDHANKIKAMRANPQRSTEEPLSSYYEGEWVKEAVLHYLHKDSTVVPAPPDKGPTPELQGLAVPKDTFVRPK